MAAHIVVAAAVELVEEILSWLPPKSAIRFKSVCKQWHNIISTPSFIATHTSRNPHKVSGFLLHNSCSNKIYDASFPLEEGGIGSAFPETCTLSAGRVLQSCNGLLLGMKCNPFKEDCHFWVYNPTTKQLKILPYIAYIAVGDERVALAFDPSRSTSYHVLIMCFSTNEVKVYHSESSSWETFIQAQWVSSLSRHNCFCNGCVYWHNYKGSVVSFDVERRSVMTFISSEHWKRGIIDFTQSRGRKLLILQQNFDSDLVEVLEMKKNHLEWLSLYKVHVEDLFLNYGSFFVEGAWFVEGDENEGDKLVLRIHHKAMIYNLKEGTFYELHTSKAFKWVSCASTLVAP